MESTPQQQIPAFDQSGSSPPQPNPPRPIDIVAESHGSIVLLHGVTKAGVAWIEEHVSSDGYQPFGHGVRVVEPRYVFAILKGAIDAGLVIA